MRILVVEDEEAIRNAIAIFLRSQGHAVDEAADLADAEFQFGVSDYDLVVLDRNLPDGDSIGLIQRWRDDGVTIPAIFLTARSDLDERVAGLESGADDYLTKPFALVELGARVAGLLRRQAPPQPFRFSVSDLVIDAGRREVFRAGVGIPLRPKEYCVLHLLASRAETAVSRSEIIEHCWDAHSEPFSNVEEATIASLRRKLGAPPLVHTIRGGGYLLSAEPPARSS